MLNHGNGILTISTGWHKVKVIDLISYIKLSYFFLSFNIASLYQISCFYTDIFVDIPEYSCIPGKLSLEKPREADEEPAEELTYEGKYNITLPEAKYSCSKDVNCAQFYSHEISFEQRYYKCPRVSHRSSDNKNGVLYVKGITKKCLSIKIKILRYKQLISIIEYQ